MPTCPRLSPTCLQHSARYDSSPVTSDKFITVFYTAAYFVTLFVNARNLGGTVAPRFLLKLFILCFDSADSSARLFVSRLNFPTLTRRDLFA